MWTPDDPLLEALLQSAEAQAWLRELTACFFDSEPRRAVLDRVRSRVVELHANLDEPTRRRLGDGAVSELCRLASSAAPAPVVETAPSHTPARRSELEDVILDRYPHPIATSFAKLIEAPSAASALHSLTETVESLIHFLATVTVSAYLRSELANADVNRLLLDRFTRGRWTLGDLLVLLRDMLRLAGDCQGHLPYADLPALLFTAGGRPTNFLRILESFLPLRNEWAHGGLRSEAELGRIVEVNSARLAELFASMPWLASGQLMRPTILEAGNVRSADLLIGLLWRRNRPVNLPLQDRDRLEQYSDGVGTQTLLLVTGQGRSYLPLSPLAMFPLTPGAGSQGVYFLRRTRWDQKSGTLRVLEAGYVPAEARLGEYVEGPGAVVARWLESHVARLQKALQGGAGAAVSLDTIVQPGHTYGFPDVSTNLWGSGVGDLDMMYNRGVGVAFDPLAGDPDHTLPAVREEQQAHLKTFVGREALLADLRRWIDEQKEGRYLLLLGPPGQGKSALMAELARREAERGGCLLHMIKSHPSPHRFCPALLSQAAQLTGRPLGPAAYAGDLDDLRNAFVRALTAVQQRFGRAVLVIDGLDELDTEGRLTTFLPPLLPEGTRIIMTSRPDLALMRKLRNRLGGCLEERALEPLTLPEFAQLVERRLEPPAAAALRKAVPQEELFQRIGGNPLYLHCLLDQVAGRWQQAVQSGTPSSFSETQFSPTLEAVFQESYERIREGRAATATGRQKARLLQLICVARQPLTAEQLSELMEASGLPLSPEDCWRRLEEISQWLHDDGSGNFRPYHQGLAEFVRHRVLGPAGLHQIEEVFYGWLERGTSTSGLYRLRFRLDHLLAAGRWDEAFALLTDLGFLEESAEAGLLFDLVAGFTEARRRLPSGHPGQRILPLLEEALRRDFHFILRHPRTLFQCLWNSCWWYDAPEAAPHYAEGRVPGAEAGVGLHRLLERWRRDRERPGFVWLRSLRPPALHLGSAQRAVFRGHKDWVRSVSWSPDNRCLASASWDGTVRVWDAASGAELLCLRGHEHGVARVAWSPDGQRLASASWDGTVRVWDAAGGAEVLCLRGHTHRVASVAFAPDGRRIASGSVDQTVRVWDAAGGAELLCLRGHDGPVPSVAFAPDGCRLASGSHDQTVRVWDAASGEPRLCLRGHKNWVTSIAFSGDGRQIASGSWDDTVRVWDAVAGEVLLCLQGHEHVVASVAFSADGRRIVSGSADRTVRVWDAVAGEALLCLQGHEGIVSSVSFSSDGRQIASGSDDGTVRIWDATSKAPLVSLLLLAFTDGTESVNEATSKAPLVSLLGHESTVTSVSFSGDGRQIVSGSAEGTVRIWDAATGAPLLYFQGHEKKVTSVAFSADRRLILSGSVNGTVRVWDAGSGAPLLSLLGHEHRVTSVAFSADGRLIVSGAWDRTVRVWDAVRGAELLCLHGHQSMVTSVCFSGDRRRIASGSDDGMVRVWDAGSGAPLLCLQGPEYRVTSLAFSGDGRRIVSGSGNGTVRVWDASSGDCLEVGAGEAEDTGSPGRADILSWRALPGNLATVIETVSDSQPVAWFPQALHEIASHPSGRLWAGAAGNYLCLFILEGKS
jgi:WD40 repeat protein